MPYMAAQPHIAFRALGVSKTHRYSVLQASLQEAKAPGRSRFDLESRTPSPGKIP